MHCHCAVHMVRRTIPRLLAACNMQAADDNLASSFPSVHIYTHTSPCSHILFTPQSYHVASTESLSFTSYSTERFEVTATLSYDQCSCSNRRRRCNNNGDVLSSVGGTTRFGVYDCRVIAAHSCRDFYLAPPSVGLILQSAVV